jgi:putative transposase
MLVGRRYRLELEVEQSAYAERVAGTCRAVWNVALEQRRTAAQLNRGRTPDRAVWPTFASQCRELAAAKQTEPWLAEAPAHCLQQTLRDLDKACRAHGPWGVHFRARYGWAPSFRFPDAQQIGEVRRSDGTSVRSNCPSWAGFVFGSVVTWVVRCATSPFDATAATGPSPSASKIIVSRRLPTACRQWVSTVGSSWL